MKAQAVAHATRKHAKFSPSASERWLTCPGSVKLSEKAPPEKESPYALEGTRAHECLEFIVRQYERNLELAEEQALKKYAKILNSEEKAAEMVAHAIRSAHTIYDLRPSPTAKLLIETRVKLSEDVYGTLDYAWVEQWGLLIVIDYKYGAGVPVLPIDEETGEENAQLMCYGTAIAKKFHYEFDSVKLAIIQPRVWRDDENPLTIGDTTVEKLRAFEKRAAKAVAVGKKPDAPLKASPDACRWCPAASFCPEISKGQLDAAGIVFDVEKGVEKLPEVEALNGKTLPVILNACLLIETWIEKVRAHAFRLACEGEKITDWKLVQKRSIRSWVPQALEAARKEFGEAAFETKLLSPAQLEKLIGKEAKPFTERFTSNVSSGYTLVKATDKRPEVSDLVAFDLDINTNEER